VEAGPVYRSPNQPTLHASSPTPSVAASTHQASQTQTYAPSAPAQIKTRKEPPKVKIITLDLDEAVYDYIVSREGEISLAKAAKDLNISVEELKSSIERLRTSGKLKSEHPPQATPSTSKYCRKCGAEMPKEAKYCPECGAKKNDQPGS
jgi:rubrerythrin